MLHFQEQPFLEALLLGKVTPSTEMPHATIAEGVPKEDDDREFLEALHIVNNIGESNPFEDHGPDTGEKAEDAVDFGDLSDDDLADDEGGDNTQDTILEGCQNGEVQRREPVAILSDLQSPEFQGESSGNVEGLDDLFGDVRSSPLEDEAGGNDLLLTRGYNATSLKFDHEADTQPLVKQEERTQPELLPSKHSSNAVQVHSTRSLLLGTADAALSSEQHMQQALFALSGSAPRKLEVPGPETREQALNQLWPRFQPNTVPNFMDLLPPKKARYLGKPPVRTPKPVHPTKISLEIATDQEKSFRLVSASNQKLQPDAGRQDLVVVEQLVNEKERKDIIEDFDSDFENDDIAGVNWQDIQMLSEDWDNQDSTGNPYADPQELTQCVVQSEREDIWDDFMFSSDRTLGVPAAKVYSRADMSLLLLTVNQRRKLDRSIREILGTPHFKCPPLHDPEYTTSRIGQVVTLDLNDSCLLIDDEWQRFPQRKLNAPATGSYGRTNLNRRYNVSNDDAYDLLKENHQSKVRSTLGNMAVEHSMPAIKLQWPFVRYSK